jgi:predicted phosphoribosyltransferase
VPVADEIARSIQAPLDLLLVRKIGAPNQPELAVGAIIDGGSPLIVRDRQLLALTGTTIRQFDRICTQELAEIERRRKHYLGGRPPLPVRGRTAIVVDDGLATGSTMRIALRVARMRDPAHLIMAVPVASQVALDSLAGEADRIICLTVPDPFAAVGYFYRDFRQVEDREVIQVLADATTRSQAGAGPSAQQASNRRT